MTDGDLLQLINNLRDYRDTLRERADGPETTTPPEDYLYGKASGIDAAVASLVEYRETDHDDPTR